MREILFRGKGIDGEWYEGSLVKENYEQPSEKNSVYKIREFTLVYTDDSSFEPAYTSGFDEVVYPQTVGQFTGLYDRTKWEELSTEEQGTFLYPENGGRRTKEEWKGRPIFEGDIVLFEDESPANYEYHDCTEMRCGAIEYGDNCFFITNRIAVEMEDLIYSYGKLDVKIIGNIHDNPELLKGENNA